MHTYIYVYIYTTLFNPPWGTTCTVWPWGHAPHVLDRVQSRTCGVTPDWIPANFPQVARLTCLVRALGLASHVLGWHQSRACGVSPWRHAVHVVPHRKFRHVPGGLATDRTCAGPGQNMKKIKKTWAGHVPGGLATDRTCAGPGPDMKNKQTIQQTQTNQNTHLTNT